MDDVLGRMEEDGSLSIWAGGWRATFPAGGGSPAVAAGAAPEGVGAPPSDVRTARRGGSTYVRYGDWIVVFGGGEPQVAPAKPDIGSGNIYLGGSLGASIPSDD